MKKIITHDRCVDGYVSEQILRDVYPDAEFLAVSYGPDLEALEPCEEMLFCDMSPPKKKWAKFIEADAVVLDHHATAKGFFDLGGRGVFTQNPGVSGAGLALKWREDQAGKSMDENRALVELACLVGIYDTWQENHKNFHDACALHAGLDLIMSSRTQVRSLGELVHKIDEITHAGKMLHVRNLIRAREAAESALRVTVRTDEGPLELALLDGVFGTPVLNLVPTYLEGADLIVFATFDKMRGLELADDDGVAGAITAPPRLKVSLRSRNGVNCGRIASRLGGGGHAGAAGFTSEPLSELRTSDLAYMMLMSVIAKGSSES